MNETETLERDLEAKRGELIRRLEAIQQDIAAGRSADSAERATEGENDDTLEEIESQSREELGQITQALQKIRAGTYGVCEGCSEAIGAERLAALPYATTCIACAARAQD